MKIPVKEKIRREYEIYMNDSVFPRTIFDGFSDGVYKFVEGEGENKTVDIDALDPHEYVSFIHGYDAGPDLIADTWFFQEKYGLLDHDVYGFLEDDKMKVKIGHLKEELAEIEKAYSEKNLYEFCDGILDLVYVALGTVNLMNMPVRELWTDIQIRNMMKVRATTETMGKRGSTFDVVKPEGWSGPRTKEIIDYFK